MITRSKSLWAVAAFVATISVTACGDHGGTVQGIASKASNAPNIHRSQANVRSTHADHTTIIRLGGFCNPVSRSRLSARVGHIQNLSALEGAEETGAKYGYKVFVARFAGPKDAVWLVAPDRKVFALNSYAGAQSGAPRVVKSDGVPSLVSGPAYSKGSLICLKAIQDSP